MAVAALTAQLGVVCFAQAVDGASLASCSLVNVGSNVDAAGGGFAFHVGEVQRVQVARLSDRSGAVCFDTRTAGGSLRGLCRIVVVSGMRLSYGDAVPFYEAKDGSRASWLKQRLVADDYSTGALLEWWTDVPGEARWRVIEPAGNGTEIFYGAEGSPQLGRSASYLSLAAYPALETVEIRDSEPKGRLVIVPPQSERFITCGVDLSTDQSVGRCSIGVYNTASRAPPTPPSPFTLPPGTAPPPPPARRLPGDVLPSPQPRSGRGGEDQSAHKRAQVAKPAAAPTAASTTTLAGPWATVRSLLGALAH